tara:strand:+ start:4546 stop:4923 length:378 start_codon:yes stop_codon:yes gene_type:complete
MPTTDLTFPNPINVSVQFNPNATSSNIEGADIIYYTPTTLNGTHNTAGTIVELGPVTAINGNTITVFYDGSTPLPTLNDFIMFAKHRGANMSSLLGYFAKFRIRNNSTEKAEMYSISVDVTESSK